MIKGGFPLSRKFYVGYARVFDWLDLKHKMSAILVFRVKFNLEFAGQVMNFP